MKLEILGNGGAFDDISTSYLIDDTILVDCSDKVAHKYLLAGKLDKVKHIFFTHRHGDHINGLETLMYYFLIQNKFSDKIDLTIYGSSDILDYYKVLACAIHEQTGEYRQPFKFVDLNTNTSSIKIGDTFCDNIPSKHMNGTLPCKSFIFSNSNRNRFIITGDMDQVNPLISKEMMSKGDVILFHDMGWTGLPDVPNNYKFHPREKEVFDFYGSNDNIIGIHTGKDLEYYKKGLIGSIFNV